MIPVGRGHDPADQVWMIARAGWFGKLSETIKSDSVSNCVGGVMTPPYRVLKEILHELLCRQL